MDKDSEKDQFTREEVARLTEDSSQYWERTIETAYLGRGWSFPVRWDLISQDDQFDREGFLRTKSMRKLSRSRLSVQMVSAIDDIRQSIILILETIVGERVMHPEFGSEIHRYVFAAITPESKYNLAMHVRKALLLWEKRIREIDVRVQERTGEIGRLDIEMEFLVDVHRMRQSLIFPFYVNHPERL